MSLSKELSKLFPDERIKLRLTDCMLIPATPAFLLDDVTKTEKTGILKK